MAGRGILIEIVGDDRSYLRAAERTISANQKIAASNTRLTQSFVSSTDAQIAARVKAQTALEANVAGFAARAKALPSGSKEAAAAAALQAEEQAKLNRLMGLSAASTARFGNSTKTAERDLNKMTRGVLAGSGVLSRLGRSLAFASSGFIAASLAAAGVVTAIKDAENLARAQESLDVAIQHTGGDLGKLRPQYTATAKAAARFGIDQIQATTGLARATVLTGNAAAAQRAYQEALVISKATGKDFNAVLIATSKGQAGITTSLRRYGILVDSTSSGQEQLNQVMRRFGGQAAANTTATERLQAAFTNTLTTIGIQLLPAFEKLAAGLADWLTKMNRSGQLQRDVASGMKTIQTVASPLVKSIKELASAVGLLNKAWNGLKDAQKGGGIKGLFAGIPAAGFNLAKQGLELNLFPELALRDAFRDRRTPGVVTSQARSFRHTGQIVPAAFQAFDIPTGVQPAAKHAADQIKGFLAGVKKFKQFTQTFQLPQTDQIAQAQAALTRGTQDDVAAARNVIARIRRLIGQGRLHGQALIQALQLEAAALGTVWSAEDAAAQKRAQRAQAAKARIQRQIENAIDPIGLEVALSRAELTGDTRRVIRALKALRAAAQKMLDSGRLSAQQQQEALQQIISLNQQIKDAATNAVQTFTVPARLALNLARDTALGRSTTKDLLAIRKAILRFIATHRHNLAALTDAYNQLADINQQLGSSAQSALGSFKQASTRALTAGLGLTPEQRAALRARLSQLGPGGTVPGQGVGAAGFIIGPDGRPIQARGRGPTISGRDSQTVSPARFNRLLRILERLADRPQRIIVDLDGKIVADNTTRHQQRRGRHNSSQRRGPLAGVG
jgi:hypothetical protein